MIDDFLRWYGGRADLRQAPVDEYAVPVLRCVLGERYTLPELTEMVPTKRDILRAAEALGQGLHESDKVEDRFTQDPDQQATRHRHHRALTQASGLVRLARRDARLAVYLARQIDHPKSVVRGGDDEPA